jgi:RNA polymerase sigma-70 factor (ECF subfamily)
MLPSVATTDSESVLAAFVRREPGAVRALYREYGRLVYAIAHHVLGRHDLAEDAVQQTFLRAWQAADRFDVTGDPAPWLATIAKNAAIDIARQEARRPTHPLERLAANDRAIASPPPDLQRLEAVWQVRRAIDTLAPDEATIVRLHHLDGLTHTQIADKLGVALGTVKSRSDRAHRKLATRLRYLREPVA